MMNKQKLGISVYLSYELECILKQLDKAKKYGFEYVFTSFQIPEEKDKHSISKIKEILSYCKEKELFVIADVGPKALSLLGIESYKQLKEIGVTHLRLDYGFSDKQIQELSKDFTLVFNASTFNSEQIEHLKKLNIDLSKVLACHNYYPKPYTGLSFSLVNDINHILQKEKIQTMAFVEGDDKLRLPLEKGLPTIEKQRNKEVLYNILELQKKTNTEVIFIGDVDLKDETYKAIDNLQKGFIKLRCYLNKDYEYLCNYIHHDRSDYSEYFLRSVESRNENKLNYLVEPFDCKKREIGTICVSNKNYARYNGEVEIMKKEIEQDDKVNVVGHIIEEDIKFLYILDESIGIKLEKIGEYPNERN